jgi:hypothetical protein
VSTARGRRRASTVTWRSTALNHLSPNRGQMCAKAIQAALKQSSIARKPIQCEDALKDPSKAGVDPYCALSQPLKARTKIAKSRGLFIGWYEISQKVNTIGHTALDGSVTASEFWPEQA